MGTEIIQNPLISRSIPNRAMEIELTREEGFLNGSKDIFDLLQHPPKKSGNIQQGDILNLLRAAYNKIEQSEQTIATQNQRIALLEDLLTTDELTKLCNRRGFFEAFKREIDRTARGQSEGGVLVLIDLDNFKSINDTYGHQAGDAALKLVAEFLRNEVRDMDVAARLGGDEFIAIFPNASKEKAMRRAQMMGLRLNNLSLIWQNTEIHIGASLGLKDYKRGDTVENIIAHADKGMYENKRTRKEALLA
jgi:diguanylate cyclase (GGDEF)-like protein